MDLTDATETQALDTGEPDGSAPSTIEELSVSIWHLTEEILELLRTQASTEVQRQKRPDVLWIDDVTRTQANTVIAVKNLCEKQPEGVTLKKLSETIGVTPAAASVMVELLVKKRMLRRTRSKNDRRAILIRLHPETARLFDITDQSLQNTVMSLADSLGLDALRGWQTILADASSALKQVVGTPLIAGSDQAETPLEGPRPGTDEEPVPEADDQA